jgi:hypothetical protein
MYCSGADTGLAFGDALVAAAVARGVVFDAAGGVAGGVAFGASAAPASPRAVSENPQAAIWGRNERMSYGWMEIYRKKSPNTHAVIVAGRVGRFPVDKSLPSPPTDR